jgi:hypothetical protein
MISTCGMGENLARTKRTQKDMTASPSKYPQGYFKSKPCGWCEGIFSPSGPSHKYCGEECFKKAYADKYYLRRYGVSLSWVEMTLVRQGYVCAICETVGFKMKDSHYTGLNLDHCHVTGDVRGLLCHNCNRGLGLFQDNPQFLERAANYVRFNTRGNEEVTTTEAEDDLRDGEE